MIPALVFPPHHLIHNPGVALDDLHHFGGDVFLHVVRHGDAVVAVLVHLHSGIHGLEEAVRIDACQDETSLVQSLGALGGGADAHRRERVPHAGEETALLGQSAAVADHGEGVHLQAVVVVETQGLVLDHPLVQLESGLLQTLPTAGMAAVEHGHVILLRHFIDGRKEAYKVLLRVDVLLPVGGKQNVLALFQSQAGVDVAGLDFVQVLVEHFGHGAAGDVGALLGQAVLRQVAAGVLRVAQVHVGDNVHDTAVGLLGQALVLAAVASLHVKNRDVQSLSPDDAQTGVGVPQHQHSVRLQVHHQIVAFGDDVAHGLAQGVPHRVQIDVRVCQAQVLEEHPIEVIVVVLAGVGQDGIEILPALGDHRRQADDLRPGAHDDEQFQFAVVLKVNIIHLRITILFNSFCLPINIVFYFFGRDTHQYAILFRVFLT